MRWYWELRGGHVHVRVFMNGGKCGDLCFRDYEFKEVVAHCPWIEFIREAEAPELRLAHAKKWMSQ